MSIRTAIFIISFFISSILCNENIGLLIVATGKYIQFVEPLILSAQTYFCKDHYVTYYVFTDDTTMTLPDNTLRIYQPQLGWPYDSMLRNEIYYAKKELFEKEDYLFACDADMRFVDHVGNEIFEKRVATLHPGYVNKRGTYETNWHSTAYVADNEGLFYFAGAFYGGEQMAFLELAYTISNNVRQDLEKNIIALWHDESHWNRYCIDFPPSQILSPSYSYPEGHQLEIPKKLLALNKAHDRLRSPITTHFSLLH